MIIKVLLIVGIAGAALFAFRGNGSTVHLAIRRIAGVLFVAAAACSVIFPDMVTWLANRVGVAQGSNLVLYALVVAFLFVAIGIHQRIHSLERRVIQLTRELALARGAESLEPPTAEPCLHGHPAGTRH